MQGHTFLFADLVGYTSLTAQRGDDAAADLAVRFAAHVGERAAALGCEVVKTLGDAVMVRGTDAGAVVRLALDLNREPSLPGIHAGVATGPAAQRGTDWFGATVNLASRLADSARAAEVLVSEGTLAACRGVAGVQLRSLGPQRFKNMAAPTDVYAAEPCGEVVAVDFSVPARRAA